MSLTSYNKIIGQKGKVEYYKKDKKELYIMETTLNEKNAKLSSYNNGERIDVFYEGPDYKNAEIDSDFISKIELHNGIDYTGSDLNTFLTCLMGVIKINSTKYNDIDCYLVTLGGKEKYYIEKELFCQIFSYCHRLHAFSPAFMAYIIFLPILRILQPFLYS